jgi:hypothetical protein
MAEHFTVGMAKKNERATDWIVSTAAGAAAAASVKAAHYCEVSAVTTEGVDELFQWIVSHSAKRNADSDGCIVA